MSTDTHCGDVIAADECAEMAQLFAESEAQRHQAWTDLTPDEQGEIYQELMELNAQGRLGDHWAYQFVFQR